MRVRNIKGIEKKIEEEAGENFIEDPSKYKGKWNEVFKNNNPIYIEIGCGKGKFITSLAEKNKNINYIAIEKVEEVLYKTVLKLDDHENLKIILGDGNDLLDYFEKMSETAGMAPGTPVPVAMDPSSPAQFVVTLLQNDSVQTATLSALDDTHLTAPAGSTL